MQSWLDIKNLDVQENYVNQKKFEIFKLLTRNLYF